MADFTENLKKFEKYNPSLYNILIISILKIPNLIIELSPFLILFSSLFAIRTLALKKEIDIFKASGLSIWQFLYPFMFALLLYSIIIVCAITTLSTISNKYLEQLENSITNKNANVLTINNNILWIIDRINKYNKNIIMAKGFESVGNKWNLVDVKVLQVENNVLSTIYQSKFGIIDSNRLSLSDVMIKREKDKFITFQQSAIIILNTKANAINNLMADANHINIFFYPAYIYTLKKLGLDTSSYETYFYNMISLPLFFLSMLLLSAFFAISDSRKGKNLYIIVITILCGFIIYFTMNFIVAMSTNGHIPIYLSMLFSKFIILLITFYLLVKKEGI